MPSRRCRVHNPDRRSVSERAARSSSGIRIHVNAAVNGTPAAPRALRQINPTGKISLNTSGKSPLGLPPSCPRGRGVGHRHRTLGWDAVDAAVSGVKCVRRAVFRERASGARDVRCQSVRQSRVVLTPQRLASSLNGGAESPTGPTCQFP
jgi:hypothetical protein